VGLNGANVRASSSSASVAGGRFVGGLTGKNNGNVNACRSSGDVGGTDDYVGGLIGDNSGSLAGSKSQGNVTGGDYVGGLVGRNNDKITIDDCYGTGGVSGGSCVGGLVGANYYVVKHCYAAVPVHGRGSNVEALVGDNSGSVLYCFWNKDIPGSKSTSGPGKTTAELRTMSTYATGLKEPWDIVDVTTGNAKGTWWILEGTSYPKLWWETPEK